MSGSLNKVILIGNIGKDPDIKVGANGQELCRFSLATTESWKDQQGVKQSKTEWHNIVIFGPLVKVAREYLKKGDPIMVEGKITYREYQDQQGAKKTSTDIRCSNLVMLKSRAAGAAPADRGQIDRGDVAFGGGDADDMPF